MITPFVLVLSDASATLENVGGKGLSLAKLARAGLPVPGGFHVTTEAYRQFVAANDLQSKILAALQIADISIPATLENASQTIGKLFEHGLIPAEISAAIVDAYQALEDDPAVVAVRSSATAEDLPEASFAGQQETYLNIYGIDAVLEAVKHCWASLWTGRAISYRLKHNIDQSTVALAAVVQKLIFAEASGVMFTANPINGDRHVILINAAWGLGEAIVAGTVTPDTITVDKKKGRVIRRITADKSVMTVRTDLGTREAPVPDSQKKKEVLSNVQAKALASYGTQIEALYGKPMDIEWVLEKGKIAIVQARPITSLPPEWRLPNPKGQYMRGSIVDLMPNPVSPLFATLAIPAISHVGIKEVLRPLTRSEPTLPEDYITTINEYAYMGVSYTPRQWWWILTRLLLSFPRIIRAALPLWRDEIHPRYAETAARWQDRSLETMTAVELWAGIQQVNDAAMMHLASLLVATTGASAGAEGLFTRIYEKMVQRDGDPPAITFLMGYDSTPIQVEKSLYDLAAWSQEHGELAAYLLETPTERLAAQQVAGSPPVADWLAFCERLRNHQKAYGHIIYDLDFAKPLPLDDPKPMLETIKMYLRDQGVNPYERQRAAEEKRVQSAETVLKQLKGLRRWVFQKTLGMAQTMAQVRENALSDIGLGYPVLRKMLHELGSRCAQAGLIVQSEDIFWLKADQVQDAIALLEVSKPLTSLVACVEQRQATHKALKRITPPPMLPPKKKYMGFDLTSFTPAAEDSQTGDTLKGIAASAGRITALACVLHGPEDFDQMKPGDVLVAGTTTPAWTPLFAMASAVVTDIGGPLSHGSIVAREYGIPAVLGTGIATRRIRSGQTITVDGSAGIVELK